MAERAIGWRDVAALLPATWQLLRAEQALRRRPVGELLALEAAVQREASPSVDAGGRPLAERERAVRIARAVARAATYGPVRSKCLARSLAIVTWLRAAGIEGAAIRLGVRRVRGDVQAHAWVTLDETVIGDAEQHVRTFTPIAAAAAAGLHW